MNVSPALAQKWHQKLKVTQTLIVYKFFYKYRIHARLAEHSMIRYDK